MNVVFDLSLSNMSRASKLLNTLLKQNFTKSFIRSQRALSTANSHILTSDLKDVQIPTTSIPEFMIPKFAKYEKLTAVVSEISVN